MKRILLVAPYGGVPGGISRWTGHLLDYYKTNGTNDCFLDLVSMGRSTFVNINSPIVYRIKSAIIDYSHIFKEFNSKLKQGQYDVMHLTSSASLSLFKDYYMIKQARRKKLKTIIHFRFGRIPELSIQKNWEWKMLLKILNIVDKAIVIDKSSYDVLLKLGFKNVILLPNPVAPEVKKYVDKKQSFVNRIPRTLLFVGHVVATKGIYELIETCKQIPDIKLKLVGHVLVDVKQDLIEKSGNAEWLEICGEKQYSDIIEEMLKCNVFVLPTYTEGFPNVILESMACACPIVTTDVGAIPEMLDIKNGFNYGICVKPKDVEGLKKAVVKMLTDKEYASSCGNNARKRVSEQYSMPIIWNKLISIWEFC